MVRFEVIIKSEKVAKEWMRIITQLVTLKHICGYSCVEITILSCIYKYDE